MKSISFDRAAGFYDETRGFPPGIADLVAASAQAALPAHARVLEAGIGTGRIALPLLARGLQVSGVDLSRRMMERLVARLERGAARPDLVQADTTRLPLAPDVFDATLMVHVIHLIPNWQEAIDELRRVLKTNGVFLTGFGSHPPGSPRDLVRKQWKQIILQYGQGRAEPGPWHFDEVQTYLASTGAILDEWTAAQWTNVFHLGRFIEALEGQVYSSTWRIAPEVFPQCIADLRAWAAAAYGSLEREFEQPRKFIWQRFRWE